MKTISTQELHRRLSARPVALFDVRGDVVYEQSHIPGALTAPLGSLTFRVADVMNPDSFIVVYSSGSDGLAEEAARRLADLKRTNVYCYSDGIDGWQAAGHQVMESVDPKVIGRGPVRECRPLIVDREHAYGGAFRTDPNGVEGAGG